MPSKRLQNALGIARDNMNDLEILGGSCKNTRNISQHVWNQAFQGCSFVRHDETSHVPSICRICGTSCNSRLVAMSVSAGLFEFSMRQVLNISFSPYVIISCKMYKNVARSPTNVDTANGNAKQHHTSKYHFGSCTSSSVLPSSHCFYKEGKCS